MNHAQMAVPLGDLGAIRRSAILITREEGTGGESISSTLRFQVGVAELFRALWMELSRNEENHQGYIERDHLLAFCCVSGFNQDLGTREISWVLSLTAAQFQLLEQSTKKSKVSIRSRY